MHPRTFLPATAFVFSMTLMSPSPALAQSERPADWCHTQIIYEAKRAADHSAQSSEACDTEGPCDNPSLRDLYRPNETTPITYIRIFVHVLTNDDGSVPATGESYLATQIDILNEDYLPYRIQFEYQMRFVAFSQYRSLTSLGEAEAMKATYAPDPASQINVYVASVSVDGEVFSYGAYPWDCDALAATDGVVMNRTLFYPYQPSTLTHKVGHCIGLYRTFRGICEVTTCGSCYDVSMLIVHLFINGVILGPCI